MQADGHKTPMTESANRPLCNAPHRKFYTLQVLHAEAEGLMTQKKTSKIRRNMYRKVKPWKAMESQGITSPPAVYSRSTEQSRMAHGV